MKYLVTGGAGFIGSHLVEALIVAGHEVHILDILSTGKKENIPSAAVFIQGDITDLESIRAAFVGIDGVFHCAADPRLPYSIQCPKETTQTNLEGTLNVLIAARGLFRTLNGIG
jgi:UDP-glucose 4-epimerase